MAISELDLPTGVVAHSLADPESQARVLAEHVAKALDFAVQTYGQANLVVSGGRSPTGFFEVLSGQALDWSRVQVCLADERWVAPESPQSNEGLVRRHLLRNAAAQARLIGLYHPAATLEQAASQASQALSVLEQGIDVLVLGMGDDGHVASLFADSPLLEQALSEDCQEYCLPMLAPQEPYQRISMTYPLLASARLQCLAIQGQAKLETLRQALLADALRMPVRAFMHAPLEIYWCP
ncbi:6-phosphogluconolactonase [Stutzerimonas kirkiae]|uniref:6-phosphogluconolactonase n=1 Tax=Stutzerimonas kirkiae TaxID=2211392 RepID=A0A4Q9RF58_9GAMM|nr:6-phosphogluconolactonase [Stutzerimonas kirkiae]TBU98951.1 6-phosphogluconolactonase [Stutzerimonas kirkiae]TBV01601.1 6-phosphogluconolactonase [Stutzerimonas kirkiae]TBV10295.1 6-phosphogluconolactonase [Stutzerimonas kirkiae]TBV16915.1 6-phosphogluconolactonase [Stutzerimonas kirkiae]